MNDTTWNLAAWWSELGIAATTGLRILIIAIGAWILILVLQRVIRGFRVRVAAHMTDREQIKRAETLGRVFRYLVAVVVSAIAVMLILAELGVSVAPILGAAGVVGLAVGFGAQSLVKDYFTGFFILLENQIRQGDVVQLGSHAGLVEEVTLRYVQLRDYDGNVHFVPNSEITTVVNMSRGYAQAVVDASVAYREDVDEVMEVMKAVGAEMRNDPGFSSRILADLEMAGVDRWDDSAVIVRCRFKTAPLEQWNVKREFLRRLKKAFDERGIEIPYPHLTVYAGEGKNGRAPAFPVRSLGDRGEAGPGAAASVTH
ncbi:MAG TPA: mechanosensitive ion channel family protein [Burkholderiaceae bacterium]|nr:mechanosensitive ion channel family protein [Burkholderiaceae bacterium]